MNTLSKEKILILLHGLVEDQSIRSLERITGIHRDTIMRWHVRAGQAAQKVMDEQIRGIKSNYIQADELVGFIGKKNAPEYKGLVMNGYKGEAWVFVALDADTKLVISYLVGNRDIPTAYRLMQDVRRRTARTFQFTTDGHVIYRDAAELALGSGSHYGQLMKVYGGMTWWALVQWWSLATPTSRRSARRMSSGIISRYG